MEDLDEDSNVYMFEAGRHDIERWPHLHPVDDFVALFRLVVAAVDIEPVSAEALGGHRALQERWAT